MKAENRALKMFVVSKSLLQGTYNSMQGDEQNVSPVRC